MSCSRSAGWGCGRRKPIGDRLETPATLIWMLARPRVTREGVDYVDVSVSRTFALSAWRRRWLALMAECVVATRQRREKWVVCPLFLFHGNRQQTIRRLGSTHPIPRKGKHERGRRLTIRRCTAPRSQYRQRHRCRGARAGHFVGRQEAFRRRLS